MNEKLKYLGKNTLVFAISSFGTKLLSFFLIPLYTNVLSTSEYGIADLITTTATLLIFVLTLDICDAVTRFTLDIQNNISEKDIVSSSTIIKKKYIPESIDDANKKRMEQESIFSYGNRVILAATLVCTLGLGIVYWLNVLSWDGYYYLFVLLYFFSTAFYQVISNYLRGIDKVTDVAIAGMISSAVIIICNILFLLVFKIGIVGYLLSTVLGPLVASLYCIIKSDVHLKYFVVNTCSSDMQHEMLSYSVPLIFNNIALWINAFLDRYFVTAMCGVDQNGIYSVASKIPNILAVCYQVFGQAWNLSAIKEFDPEDKDGFFGKTYNVYNAFMTCMCSLIILFNIPLAKFLYAKDFFTAWQYSSVLLISVMFNALTMFLGAVFSAVKQTKAIAWTTILSAICNTVLNSILIPLMGPLGAAIATAVAYGVMWLVRIYYSKKYINFEMHFFINCLAYGLVCLQTVFEHMNGHFYLGQIICFAFIIILYHKQIFVFARKLFNTFLKK